MDEAAFLPNLAGALLAALMGGVVARVLRLPVLVGYIVAGIAVGPHTPGFIADRHAVESVARLGVALLMFVVGVQFHLKDLTSVRRIAVLGGGVQIVLTIGLGLGVGITLGWGVYGGIFVGCAIALSSTAVMMRVLEERGELGSAHGRAMLGILVVQDLSLVLMVALLPSLATVGREGPAALAAIGGSLLIALALVAVSLLLAFRLVPMVLDRVARLGSPELFLMMVVCICLGAAFLARLAGLSLEIGAFLAGIVISESEYAHQVFSQVRPLRDLFAALFFVSMGMLLNPDFVIQHWPAVLLVVAAILVGKALLTAFALYVSGAHGQTAVFVALGLAQIGEFSVVLASLGAERRLVAADIPEVLLAAAMITILLTPLTYGMAAPLYRQLNRSPFTSRLLNRGARPVAGEPETPVGEWGDNSTPVLLLGCGRVGTPVCDALHDLQIPQVVVEYDAVTVRRLQARNIPVIYGDATSDVVLTNALGCLTRHPGDGQPPRALRPGMAVVALPEAGITRMAVQLLKRLLPDLWVIARAHQPDEIDRIRESGADVIVQPELEAAAQMLRLVAEHLTLGREKLESRIRDLQVGATDELGF